MRKRKIRMTKVNLLDCEFTNKGNLKINNKIITKSSFIVRGKKKGEEESITIYK